MSTTIAKYQIIQDILELLHVAFPDSNHITINEAVSTFAMKIKS